MHIIGLIRAYAAQLCKSYEYQRVGFAADVEPGVWLSLDDMRAARTDDSGRWVEGIAVGRGVSFHGYREEAVKDLPALAQLLRSLESQSDVSLVLGAMRPNAHFQMAGPWRDALKRTKDMYEDRASNLLVLDIDKGTSDEDDPRRAVRETLDSIDELNGCAYVAQLSSSRGIKPGLRVRVFVETAKALTLEQQHAFISAYGALFDGKIYLPGHIIASSAPRLTARIRDTVHTVDRPVRGDTIWYEPGGVAQIEPIDVRELARAAGVDLSVLDLIAANSDTRDKRDYVSNDDLLRQLAPGSINEPLNRLICSVAWVAPDSTHEQDFQELYARVMTRLREISITDGRFDERRRVHMRPGDWKQRWDKARQRRADKFAQELAATRPIIAPAVTAQPVADTRTPRERLIDDIREAGRVILEDKNPMQYLVVSAPGAGKSYGVRSILTPGVLMRSRVRIFVPTHALAEQLCSDLQTHVATLTPDGTFFGANLAQKIRHHKGRTQPGMCINEKHGALAQRAEQAGLGARSSVCKACPDRDTCPWFAQKNDLAEGVIIEAHQNLVSRGAQADDWADLYVIDESAFSTVVGTPAKPIPVKALTNMRGAARANSALARMRAELAAIVQKGFSPKLEWGRVPMPTNFDVADALEAEEKHRKILQNNIMSAMPQKLSDMLEQYNVSCVATNVYENIRDSAGRPNVFGVRVHRRRWREKRNTRHEDEFTSLRRSQLPERLKQVGAIWLDGTAALDGDLSVWRAVVDPTGADFPHAVINAEPIASPHVSITQLLDNSYAKSTLSSEGDPLTQTQLEELEDMLGSKWQLANTCATPEEAHALAMGMEHTKQALETQQAVRKQQANSRLHMVWRTICSKAYDNRGQDILLVAQKSVITRLKTIGLPENVKCAWFGALRGLNAYKDVPCAIVIGRPAADYTTLELMCEALHSGNKNVTYIESAMKWGRARATVQLKDGTQRDALCEAHPDVHAQKLQKMISHAEVIQAVARVRPFDRDATKPCDLLVMGQWPMQGMLIDQATDLVSVTPPIAELAIKRGFASEVYADNGKIWPNLTLKDSYHISSAIAVIHGNSAYTDWTKLLINKVRALEIVDSSFKFPSPGLLYKNSASEGQQDMVLRPSPGECNLKTQNAIDVIASANAYCTNAREQTRAHACTNAGVHVLEDVHLCAEDVALASGHTCNCQFNNSEYECVELVFEKAQGMDSVYKRHAIVLKGFTPDDLKREYGVQVRSWRVLTPGQVDELIRRRVAATIAEHGRINGWLASEASEARRTWAGCVAYAQMWMGVDLSVPNATL